MPSCGARTTICRSAPCSADSRASAARSRSISPCRPLADSGRPRRSPSSAARSRASAARLPLQGLACACRPISSSRLGLHLRRRDEVLVAQRLQPRPAPAGPAPGAAGATPLRPRPAPARAAFHPAGDPAPAPALAASSDSCARGIEQAAAALIEAAQHLILRIGGQGAALQGQHEHHVAGAHRLAFGHMALQHAPRDRRYQANHAAIGHQHTDHPRLAGVLAEKQQCADQHQHDQHAHGEHRQRNRTHELHLTQPRLAVGIRNLRTEYQAHGGCDDREMTSGPGKEKRTGQAGPQALSPTGCGQPECQTAYRCLTGYPPALMDPGH